MVSFAVESPEVSGVSIVVFLESISFIVMCTLHSQILSSGPSQYQGRHCVVLIVDFP